MKGALIQRLTRARKYQIWEVDVKTHPPAWAGKVDLRLINPPINETEFPHPTRCAGGKGDLFRALRPTRQVNAGPFLQFSRLTGSQA